MSPTQFRYTLLTYMVLAILGGVFDFVFPFFIPESLRNAQEASDANLSLIVLICLAILILVLLVSLAVVIVGLYLFRPWARRLAVVITVLALFVWPLLGINVASGWSLVLTDLAGTLWGAILALIFFSPLKECFDTTQISTKHEIR
ncbi:hypothetical protein [Methylomonas fluvii]|uniref:Uncharacterized protein n=1 Tax=Methylomonas fluvii TaxID=1854564 RepID=A0ABR9D9C4_9GAMM|nr:hypothetical protein [Methylomonas fluvii]MBD9359714.1 hypothetical protein [Methylomonas fluvii]CAD6872466.1 hypothetical protein [Methylomonas fluvii]